MKISKQKTVLLKIVRFVVSTGLIFWLLRQVEFEELKTALYGAKWRLFALSTVIIWTINVVASFRWQVILAVSGTHVPVFRLFYWYMMASFAKLFLPTALGGDVLRVYELVRYKGKKADTIASVVMERMLGFLAIIGMAVTALLISTQARKEPKIYLAVCAVCIVYVLLLIVLFHGTFSRAVIRLFRYLRLSGIGSKLEHGYAALHILLRFRKALLLAGFFSVLCQVMGVISIYLIGLSLGLDVSLSYYFLFVPIIWLITMLPISISGIGVREGGFVLFFTTIGVSNASALLLSFLSFSQLVILGLLGGCFYLVYPWFFNTRKS